MAQGFAGQRPGREAMKANVRGILYERAFANLHKVEQFARLVIAREEGEGLAELHARHRAGRWNVLLAVQARARERAPAKRVVNDRISGYCLWLRNLFLTYCFHDQRKAPAVNRAVLWGRDFFPFKTTPYLRTPLNLKSAA